MLGKSPSGPGNGPKTPEKKKRVAPKKVENVAEETSQKDYEKYYKSVERAQKKAQSFGFDTTIKPENKAGQKEAAAPVEQGGGSEEPPINTKDIETMTTRVKGMREGLELRRKALEGEKVEEPSVEEQTAEHGVTDATIEEKEAALKELAGQNSKQIDDNLEDIRKENLEKETALRTQLAEQLEKEGKNKPAPKAPEPTPAAPRTPEETEGELRASLEAARAEAIEAGKVHKESRKQRGLMGRAWDKVVGNPVESDEYKLAKHKYESSRLAMAHFKLGMDEYQGNENVFKFIADEATEYQKLLTPEKQSMIMRALQGYARMPAPARIGISIALSTVAVTGAIAATGGFAGLSAALSFAGYRAARTGAGVALSTAATEGVGKARNNTIDTKQSKEREALMKGVSSENLDSMVKRMDAMIAERKKYDKGTAVLKVLTAAVVGGTTGAALTEIASQLDTAAAASDVFNKGATPLNMHGASGVTTNLEGMRTPAVESTDLNPHVQSYDDPMHTPPYPPSTSDALGNPIPGGEQGFGNEPINHEFGDDPANPNKYSKVLPVETKNIPTGEPYTQAETRAPSDPITVTTADAKKGLWGILERKLTAEGAITDNTSVGQKNAMIADIENKLRALGPDKLKELGFRPGVSGADPLRIIIPGDKLDLSMFDVANADSPAVSTHAEVPLPPERPTIVQAEAPAPKAVVTPEVPAQKPIVGAPLNITPDAIGSTSTAEALQSTERPGRLTFVPITTEQLPLDPQSVKGAWPLLAKGIMSKPEDVYSNYYGRMNFKGLGLSFDQYSSLNSDLIEARDKYKISFDNNKLVGKVLEELAQKRAASGVKA